MTEREPTIDPAASPCIGICQIDREVCVGCYRTLDEIGGYGRLSRESRMVVNARAAERKRLAMQQQDDAR